MVARHRRIALRESECVSGGARTSSVSKTSKPSSVGGNAGAGAGVYGSPHFIAWSGRS